MNKTKWCVLGREKDYVSPAVYRCIKYTVISMRNGRARLERKNREGSPCLVNVQDQKTFPIVLMVLIKITKHSISWTQDEIEGLSFYKGIFFLQQNHVEPRETVRRQRAHGSNQCSARACERMEISTRVIAGM